MTNDPKPMCNCPLLRLASESEKMVGMGIVPAEHSYSMSQRINAILVGQLRAEHGCSGNKMGTCPFAYVRMEFETDPNVPLLHRSVEDGQDHFYN